MGKIQDQIRSNEKLIRNLELEIKSIRAEIWKLQSKCTHPHKKRWNDPSGNNGGGYECLECGADL